MRRGRSWRGDGGGPRRPFRGRGPGYNPRGFLSPAPPRLNRPPWPHLPIPPLLQPFGPNASHPAESYDDDEIEGNFSHNFQHSPNKGFQHGPPNRFQRGKIHGKRHEYEQDTESFETPDYNICPPKFQGSVWQKGKAPSIFQKDSSDYMHSSSNYDQNIPDEDVQNLTDFNEERSDFPQGRADFNPSQRDDNHASFGKRRNNFHNIQENESLIFEQRPPAFDKGPPDIPQSRPKFKTIVYDNEHEFGQSCLKSRPPKHLNRLHKFTDPDRSSGYNPRRTNYCESSRSQNNFQHNIEIDFSQPPPFHHLTSTLDYDLDDRRLHGQISNRMKNSGKTLLPTPDYSGQRPPATDHYTESSAIDDGFNKSIGDTVDIIKKKLLNRQENPGSEQSNIDNGNQNWSENESPSKQERCHKRQCRKETGSIKTKSDKKCARMKKKIVQEMFKMDKTALLKFVDDPQSSAKFEYALNSLITESRNSLNRQMRSAAEKSLPGTSSTLTVCGNDDTVYEDTFMAQMQGVLDPRDIIMLSDIKPMVMAEINKVLELDEYGHHQSYSEENESFHDRMTRHNSYDSEVLERNYGPDPFETGPIAQEPVLLKDDLADEGLYMHDRQGQPQPLAPERRNSRMYSQNSRSHDLKFSDDEETLPKFPDNLDSLSDTDEYTFAELDKQYHVAVVNMDDPIERSISPPDIIPKDTPNNSTNDNTVNLMVHPNNAPGKTIVNFNSTCEENANCKTDINTVFVESNESHGIKNEPRISYEGEDDKIIQSGKLIKDKKYGKGVPKFHGDKTKKHKKGVHIKKEPDSHQAKQEFAANTTNSSDKSQFQKKAIGIKKEPCDNNICKTSSKRKTDIDDKISHTKERRKKYISSRNELKKSEMNKKVLNKNIIINVNDCASKISETCEPGTKSVFNLFFSKQNDDELRQDKKRSDSLNISYSDKYVKRKHSPDNEKDHQKTEKKKTKSVSESTPSPAKDTSIGSSQSTKSESKAKLQPINMFHQTPRKPALHTAYRNTAIISPESTVQPNKPTEQSDIDVKSPPPALLKKDDMAKVIKKCKNLTCSSTQTLVNIHSRFTQTKVQLNKKMVSKECQTDPLVDEKCTYKISVKPEDVLERMKQIDLEIQQLLQEKFKLYNNMESAEPIENNRQSFGMAVVNMEPNLGEDGADESGIIETFANMSEEELQEIALQDIPDTTATLETSHQESEVIIKNSKKFTKKSHTSSLPYSGKVDKNAIKKRKRFPKIVLKLNKSPDGKDSIEKYKVVKPPKKQKKVSFSDITEGFPSASRQIPTLTNAVTVMHSVMIEKEENIDTSKCQENCDLSEKPKSHKNIAVMSKPKKTRKIKKLSKKEMDRLLLTVRDCSIVVTRETLSPTLLAKLAATDLETESNPNCVAELTQECDDGLRESNEFVRDTESPQLKEVEIIESKHDIIVISDEQEVPGFSGIQLHDDMLDVSEDIVIDGNFDIDKPVESFVETGPIPQGNNLSPNATKDSCKLYDFSASGEFGADMIKVSGHGDAVVAMECINDNFLAASIDGNVYYYDGREGRLLTTLRGSNFPLTCLSVVEEKHGTTVYTGSLDSRIRYYDLETGMEKGPECNVLSPIQSMDRAWGTIFVGTRTGFVLQFECKNNMLIPVSSVKFSEQTILALRALKEGPRKVLLVASRSDQVVIKDAQSGLLLRTLEGPKMTVYCLLYEDGKVFCGTSTSQIQVFDFTSGASVGAHDGGKGVVCLRAAGGLLLAGCYDGCVYVYRGRAREPVAQLRGPSNMLLSLAVVHCTIVASYKDRSVFMWKIPVTIQREMVL